MKKCPYCSEEIQDDAIKCKHCNEWLQKRSILKNTIGKTTEFVKAKIEARNEKKLKHLYLPTIENPLIIERLKIYPDKLIIDSKEYSFKNLKNIVFYSGSSSYNFITMSDYSSFYLYFKNGKTNEGDLCIKIMCWIDDDKAIIKSNANRKIKEQVVLMYNYISEKTFSNRLSEYLKEIHINKCFNYGDYYIIHENGDVYIEGKYKDNIRKAYDEDRLDWGSSWKGLKSYSINPYEFNLYKNPGTKMQIFGVELAKKTKIGTTVDHDIFTVLMISFLKNGSFLLIDY